MEIFTIGTSDYTRKQIESGDMGWSIGASPSEFIERIKEYEDDGYTITFKTSLWRKIFCLGIYKIIATK
jgi:DNA-binding Lrp family transcriptional regulator